jgi:hypothetical protein
VFVQDCRFSSYAGFGQDAKCFDQDAEYFVQVVKFKHVSRF